VLSPDAIAHFCLLLAMGSALVPPGLHAVDEAGWAALLARLVAALAPAGAGPRTTGTDRARHEDRAGHEDRTTVRTGGRR
jgi:hypothetical protein